MWNFIISFLANCPQNRILGVHKQSPPTWTSYSVLVLVVDDEAAIRQITKTTLETYDYKVITGSDGMEAVALYVEYEDSVSVAIVDMMMPRMDGAKTIRTLQKINPKVKIIAVSGYADYRIDINRHLLICVL